MPKNDMFIAEKRSCERKHKKAKIEDIDGCVSAAQFNV